MYNLASGITRRHLLSGGTALALTGSTAGCLSFSPLGQDVQYDRVDVPDPVSSEPVYRRWMPADHEIPDHDNFAEMNDTNWVSVTPGNLGLDTVGGEFRIGADVAMAGLDYFGTEFQCYDYVHGFGDLGVVAEGDIEPTAVSETLIDSGYSSNGTYYDWDLFDRTDIPRVVAVSESVVVQSTGHHRLDGLETLLDAGDGRIDRYQESDELFDSFSEWVGSYPTIMQGFSPNFAESEPTHTVMAYTFDEEAAYYSYLQQYSDGETPTDEEIKHGLEQSQDRDVRGWTVDIEIDDPRVAVQMRVDKDEFSGEFVADRRPYMTWGVDDDGQTVTFRHEAGDSVPVDRIDIEPETAVITELEQGTTFDAGDELTVDTGEFPADEDTVRIVYNYKGDSSSVALLHYTLSE